MKLRGVVNNEPNKDLVLYGADPPHGALVRHADGHWMLDAFNLDEVILSGKNTDTDVRGKNIVMDYH